MAEETPCPTDIDFDSLVDLEESCLRQGFAQGKADSRAKVGREGLALGLDKGWTLGQELGEIKGSATFYSQLLANDQQFLQVGSQESKIKSQFFL